MNVLDAVIAIPILWGMFRGFRRGFILEISTLMALILGVYGALAFGARCGTYIHEQFNTVESMSQLLGFAVIFILIVVGVHLFGRALQKILQLVALGLVNRLFGLVFGGAKWMLFVGCLVFAVDRMPAVRAWIGEERIENSLLYRPISEIIPFVYPWIMDKADFEIPYDRLEPSFVFPGDDGEGE